MPLDDSPSDVPKRSPLLSGRFVRVVLRGVLLVGLAVLGVERRGLLVVLAGVGDRGWAVGVLGSLDELGLGLLEALGLAAAGLLDRAPGLVADARRP